MVGTAVHSEERKGHPLPMAAAEALASQQAVAEAAEVPPASQQGVVAAEVHSPQVGLRALQT